ncbi:MAG: hypothetical protein HYT72_01375 [Candidatus Aenigmarchaeota archaeon]|nr:hypothetical protein [Candidatus Aenigmarchaeota archaeon]
MNLKTLLLINTAIFSVGFLAHLSRIVLNTGLKVFGVEIPLWLSAIAVLVTGYMTYQNYAHSKKRNSK